MANRNHDPKKTHEIALSGLLFALAMALSFIEGTLVIPGLAPGMKLGLANIVVMYALFFMGARQALYLDLLKALFVFLVSGWTAGFLSLCGGLLSLLVMWVLYYKLPFRPTWFILSVCGALSHNIGQLLGAGLILSSAMSLYYAPVMLVLGVGLSFWMNARLSLVFFVCIPILAVALFFIMRKVAPMYARLQAAVDHVNGVVREGLVAIRAVKAFVRGEYEAEKFSRVNGELMDTSRRTFRYAVLNLPAFQLVMYTSTVLLLWFGGNMILRGQLQVGELTGFLSYVMQVMNSLMMISNMFLLLTRSLASARRIGEVLDEAPALTSPPGAVKEIADGSIDFCGVSFKYRPEAREYALSDIELHIPAGQTVGILGGTGAAKSTLVQLIPRLYDASIGQVRVGGRDVREYDLAALRDAVGIVLQKNVLFSGTVRENLLWGNPSASEEELWQACRAACADEFLARMPKGLDTDLGQGGVNVSGGQKQRLCIARTLLKKPKVLIFDDSTSAVDTATEGRIRTALAGLSGVTKIIIAQRITSVMETDQIVVLDDGRLHACGTHEQLLQTDAIYQEIYHSQMKGGDGNGTPVER